jgi:hypothetical protein
MKGGHDDAYLHSSRLESTTKKEKIGIATEFNQLVAHPGPGATLSRTFALGDVRFLRSKMFPLSYTTILV